MRGRSVEPIEARSVGDSTLLIINYPSDSFHTVQEWIHGHRETLQTSRRPNRIPPHFEREKTLGICSNTKGFLRSGGRI